MALNANFARSLPRDGAMALSRRASSSRSIIGIPNTRRNNNRQIPRRAPLRVRPSTSVRANLRHQPCSRPVDRNQHQRARIADEIRVRGHGDGPALGVDARIAVDGDDIVYAGVGGHDDAIIG
ncbi:hypothetical protein BZG36_05291, partial [Bifiguratus adelaidae]